MPVIDSYNHKFLSETPVLSNVTLDRITVDGPKGRIVKPDYDEKLKNKMSAIGITLKPDTIKNSNVKGPQRFMVHDSSDNHIGSLVINNDLKSFKMNALVHKNQPSTSESLSKMAEVASTLDTFASEINSSPTPKFRGRPDFEKEENILPGAVDGRGRKRYHKTRKYRSRKHKKTRKH